MVEGCPDTVQHERSEIVKLQSWGVLSRFSGRGDPWAMTRRWEYLHFTGNIFSSLELRTRGRNPGSAENGFLLEDARSAECACSFWSSSRKALPAVIWMAPSPLLQVFTQRPPSQVGSPWPSYSERQPAPPSTLPSPHPSTCFLFSTALIAI